MGITGKTRPVYLLPNFFDFDILDNITSHHRDEIKYNGFQSNIVIHTGYYHYKQLNLSLGGEFSFYQIFEKDYSKSFKQENPCDPYVSKTTFMSIQTQYGFTPLLFVGTSTIRVFAGIGIGRINKYERGYSFTSKYSYNVRDGEIYPFNINKSSWTPILKWGIRMGFNM